MKTKKLFKLLLVALIGCFAVSATAAVREVGPGKTYSTIQDAVNAASNGEEIIVYEGTYAEVVSISKDNLDIHINAGDKVLVEGAFNLSGGAENNLFEGFYVKPTTQTACYSAGVSRNNTWRNMVVYGNSSRAAFGGSGMYGSDTIDHCTVYDCLKGGSYGTSSSAVMTNSILAFNADGWSSSGGSPISYSNWYHNPDPNSGYEDTGVSEDVATCISDDPLFASTNPDDPHFLYLRPISPSNGTASDSNNMGALPTVNELHVGAGQTYSTIQSAVNASVEYDEIIVHGGVYSETVSLSSKSNRTIRANSGNKVLIKGGFSLYEAANNLFEGFYVEPTSSTACYSNDVSRNNTWRNIVVYGNNSQSAFGGSSMYGSDIIEHCTIYDCLKGGSYGSSSSAIMTDSILAFNADGWSSSSGSAISYSNWYDNPTGDSGYSDPGVSADGTCISADPLFALINPYDLDFLIQLNSGSPCIGTASDSGNMGAEININSDDPPASGDPAWNIEYLGQKWPAVAEDASFHALPAWNKYNYYGSASLDIEDDDLYLSAYANGASYWYYWQEGAEWDADFWTTGVTIEFRVRVTGETTGTGITATDDLQGVYVQLYGDPDDANVAKKVVLKGYDTQEFYLDTTQWHTYRVVAYDATAYLYIDGKLNIPVAIVELDLVSSGNDKLLFGDNGSGAMDIDWDYVRAYTGGAEPQEPNYLADDPVGPNDPSWSFEYLGQKWPATVEGGIETPEWNRHIGGTGATASLSYDGDDMYLRQDTSRDAYRYYYQTDPGSGAGDPDARNWDVDFSVGATVECRVRVVGLTSGGASLFMGSDTSYTSLQFSGDPDDAGKSRITLSGEDSVSTSSIDTTLWHTYRLVVKDDKVGLYVDGSVNPILMNTLVPATDDELRFGDVTTSGAGNVDWDYVRAYLDGPVPELPGELLSSNPNDEDSFPRKGDNFIIIYSTKSINELPDPPLSITQVGTGNDVFPGNFTYYLTTRAVPGDTLVVTETGTALADKTWYRVEPVGGWIMPFVAEMPTLRGDIDGAGNVDFYDFALLAELWMDTVGTHQWADLDGNETIDLVDVEILAEGWLETAPLNPMADMSFTKFAGNPLVVPSVGGTPFTTDPNDVLHQCVRRKDATSPYMMWYTGEDASSIRRIHLATSNDGVNFTKQAMVLDKGNLGDFDEAGAHMPVVIRHGNQWKMWYVGKASTPGPGWQAIGYATSSDGITWTKHGKVFDVDPDPGAFDSDTVRQPAVIYDTDDSLFKMWYQGTNDSSTSWGPAGYATSSDGINWTRVARISDDSSRLISAEVLKIGSIYHMWHNVGPHLGYSISVDGIVWDDDPDNPVLKTTSGSWDSDYIQAPSVVYDSSSNTLNLYYNGYSSSTGMEQIGGASTSFTPVE